MLIDNYICHLRDVRRYSHRTVDIYHRALEDFVGMLASERGELSDDELVSMLIPAIIRSYEVHLLDSKPPKSAKTVGLHLSALSGFCKYLMKEGKLASNPVKLVPKPKVEKRLPHFFRKDSLDEYFTRTEDLVKQSSLQVFYQSWQSEQGKHYYNDLLSRVIISTLFSLGVRRSELIALQVGDVDFGRNVVKVRGKGDKMREIPLVSSLSEELLLYLRAVEAMCDGRRSLKESFFITYGGSALYPVFVDRVVKDQLGGVKGITGRKSPHVLRHSLATELMNGEANLNSIKEMLGHSSLSSTQIYTHSSVARLKNIYKQAHPRVKNGGKHGD